MKLYKFQEELVGSVLEELQVSRSAILACYTGSGKTNIFLEICKRLIKKNPQVRIGVSCYLHTTIKDQTLERAGLFLKETQYCAIRSMNRDYEDTNVYFFNPQTLFWRPSIPFKFDYLIVDEAHAGMGFGSREKYFSKIIQDHCTPKVKILGVSATAWDLTGSPFLKEAKVFSRGMDQGLHVDHLLSDFDIHVERASIKMNRTDFSKKGDLKSNFIMQNFDLLKKVTVEKTLQVIKSKRALLGEKCLIIVPKGNHCEIAKTVATSLGASALYLIGHETAWSHEDDEQEKIREFRSNPKRKFLVVVNKCQIGFDMPELTSTIDLTMTRNVGLLIQRWGRLARKFERNGRPKNFFYMIDDSMLSEEAEWVIGKSIEYAMCHWKLERKLKKHRVRIFNISEGKKEFSSSFSNLLGLYSGMDHKSIKKMSFSEETAPSGSWNREALIIEARKYKSRTELSTKNRYVYNRLKKFFETDLNEIFPLKVKSWTLESALDTLREETKKGNIKHRRDAKNKFPGAMWLIQEKGFLKELDSLLPAESKGTKHSWTKEKVLRTAKECRNITELNRKYNQAYKKLVKLYPEEIPKLFP